MADVEDDGKTCKECGKSFNKKWRLEEHKRSHTGERPYHCAFDGCGKSFIRPYHLKRHMGTHTGQSFKCSYPGCTQTFSVKHNLKRHEKRSHNNPFKCQYDGCHQSFKKSSQLTRHICVHTNESPFKCQVEGCDAGFNTSAKLKRHMRRHNKGYVCSSPGCSAAFDKFSKLAVHIRSHGYICEHCNRKFSQVWELRRHAVIHSNNRKMYECPREGCSRVYTKAFNLKVHIKAFHEGNRPFVCTWEGCGKGFAHKVSLRQHLALHSQRKIKPTPPLQDKKKKRRKPVCIAKKLSGYRSSPSESSDTHCTETAPRRRKTPSQPPRNETDTVIDATEVNSVDSPDGTPRAVTCSTSGTSQSVTASTNSMSPSEELVTTNANHDSSERMQIDVISGTCSSLSLVSSGNDSAATFGSQARSAPSSISIASCNDSVATIANEGISHGIQAGVSSVASSTFTSSSNDSEATIVDKDTSHGTEAGVPSGASSTLISSRNDSASTIANKNGMQARVTPAFSSTLGTLRNSSTAVVVCTERADRVDDEITSTPGSTSFQEQNEDTFADDKMFSSSDEDEEGMDWEPAVSEHSEVESLVESESEPENSFENTYRNDSLVTEEGPKDKRSSSEPSENSSAQRINAEMVSTALAAVSGSDSFGDNMPLALLAEVSSSVKRTEVGVTRGHGIKKKKGKVMKKNSDTQVHDGRIVEELNSGSEEIVSVLKPDPPAAGLKAVSNNSDISEGVNALGNTNFPGMDDVLQVIIEEEENDLDGSRLETGLQNAGVNVVEECFEIKRQGDSSEERKSESISSKEQGISFSRIALNPTERSESSSSLPLARGSHGETNSKDGVLLEKQDALEVESFREVSNDYGKISSDEESISIVEQQKSACGTPNAQGVHYKGINKQSCLVTRTVACDRVNESQVNFEVNNSSGDTRSSVGVANDSNFHRTLPQSTCKISMQKNKKNAGTKGSVDKRSTSASAKLGVPSTVKSKGKSAHRASQLTSKVSDVETETENSQTIQKSKEEPHEDVSKAKFRSRGNIFACDLQTLELLWNFKGK